MSGNIPIFLSWLCWGLGQTLGTFLSLADLGCPRGSRGNNKRGCRVRLYKLHIWGKPKVPPPAFGSPPFSRQRPQDKFSVQMQIDTLQMKIEDGRFLCNSKPKLQVGGRQSLFGGCRFTFWRVPIYVLEAKIILGVLYRKGGTPVLKVPANIDNC